RCLHARHELELQRVAEAGRGARRRRKRAPDPPAGDARRRPRARSVNTFLYELDKRIGEGIEDAVRAHHRRRLRRVGWDHALDADGLTWASGDPPPREGNAVDVLVDGDSALPAIAQAIHGARAHVHVANWH